MDVRCRIELLGRLRVTRGDREITRFSTQKTGALLGYLAYHLKHTHPREVLMDILWGGGHPRAELLPRAHCPGSGRLTHP